MGRVVVVGGGQAAASLVGRLGAEGFDGQITIVSDEPVAPYQRPPLSKAYLLGEMGLDRLLLRNSEFYAEHNIDLRLGMGAEKIDRAAAEVVLWSGERLGYDHLALCTGSTPRRLPAAIGGALEGVYSVRTLADVDAMAPEFTEGRRLLIVGGGYIGLEAAAVAAKKGLKVTLVEMAPRILQRVAAPETSDYFRALHRANGVDIREGLGLERLLGERRVHGARFSDGTELAVDFAIVGVGILPNVMLAEDAGLAIENGIWTDAHCRTSDQNIYAAGDCASCMFEGNRIRLESVGNAIDMGDLVARNILGQNAVYEPHPWFWSDQYDCKLQIAGLNAGYDAVHVKRGEEPGHAVHWYYKGDRLIAVDAMNAGRDYMVGKRLIEAGKSPAPEVLCDPATDLKALLKS